MKLIYIAGDDRSGSTMLDMMLSGHSNITSIGEAHQLRAYANQDYEYYKSVHKLDCMCGKIFTECEFWNDIQVHLGKNLGELDLKLLFLRSDFKGKPFQKALKKAIWLVLQVRPGLYNLHIIRNLLDSQRIQKESHDLYRAVAKSAHTKYVLDSSKSPFRLRTLMDGDKEGIKVILLCRDYKGVINSKVKRGVGLLKAAYRWKWNVRQMDLFSRGLPGNDVLRIRYEDLCNDTNKVMNDILSFLELEFESDVLKRNTQRAHNLGGSPSKYNLESTAIKLDESYKSNINEEDLKRVRKIVKNEAKLWGYD